MLRKLAEMLEKSQLELDWKPSSHEGTGGGTFYERKAAKYADLVAECRESGWSVRLPCLFLRWEPEALWADQHHACSRTWDYGQPH